jgi:hypothetical protein
MIYDLLNFLGMDAFDLLLACIIAGEVMVFILLMFIFKMVLS